MNVVDLLKRSRDQAVVVLGDVMLDKFEWGRVRRISPEAPVPVVKVDLVLNMADPLETVPTRPANRAVYLVSQSQQEFGEIGAVLACDPCDESTLWHNPFLRYWVHRLRLGSHDSLAKWASTIMAISWEKDVVGFQPKTLAAFDASATVWPVSVGRVRRSSATTAM